MWRGHKNILGGYHLLSEGDGIAQGCSPIRILVQKLDVDGDTELKNYKQPPLPPIHDRVFSKINYISCAGKFTKFGIPKK